MTPPRGRSALAGAVTGLAGLALAQLAADVLRVRAGPVAAVAEMVVQLTPGVLVEAAIAAVGRYDKPILLAGVVLAIPLLGAAAGLLAARRVLLGQLVFAAMGLISVMASLARPGFTPVSLLPPALGVLVWTVLLEHLVGAARPTPTLDASRRRFLLHAGAATAGAAALAAGGRFVGRARRAAEAARAALRLPVTRGAVPAGAELGLAGTSPWRVPNRDFYRIDTALVVPAVVPSQWRLRIHGRVDRELVVTYQDLLDRERHEAWVTLCCVSNEVGGDLVGNAWWSGVRVADLLREAGVDPAADAVLQTSHDGWTCGTPLAALTDGRDALLAVAMNGEPLPLEHGFPVRTVVPGLYGFVSATKWVTDIEVTRFADFSAYWTERGWAERGPVKTQSRIEVPGAGRNVGTGTLRVGGHAWAQHTGIQRVEFSLDGGAWQRAELGRVPSQDTWVQWAGTVSVDAGPHTLTVRATDRAGATQTAARAGVVPDGATGWHRVDFSAG